MTLDLLEHGGVIADSDAITLLVPHTGLDPSSVGARYWQMWADEAFRRLN